VWWAGLRIGLFHPCLNLCGGGEWVALNVIDSLRRKGHKVIVLTDEKIDQTKFERTFGQPLDADGEIVFRLRFFRSGDALNIYTNAVSSLVLKSKCKIAIDTFTCTILPGIDAVYIHYPLFKQFESATKRLPPSTISRLKSTFYYLPYRTYERRTKNNQNRVIFANSKFTSKAIRDALDRDSFLLYPPVSSFFLENHASISLSQRHDQVVTVSRLAPEKNLEIIPRIAQKSHCARFIIIGNRQNQEVQSKLSKLIRDLNVGDRVKIMTDVSRNSLREILLSSKVYLHSAMNEHFGISIFEAMACGCLPVVHDSGGPREFVPASLRYVNPEEATTKIEQVISDWSPQDAERMISIASKFSQKSFSQRLVNILTQVDLLPPK
jgi:glycosyltransferase involved in cell wall biosynthesis